MNQSKYEVRYHSEMVSGMALYGAYPTKEAANAAAQGFRQHVYTNCTDPRVRASLLKSIAVGTT